MALSNNILLSGCLKNTSRKNTITRKFIIWYTYLGKINIDQKVQIITQLEESLPHSFGKTFRRQTLVIQVFHIFLPTYLVLHALFDSPSIPPLYPALFSKRLMLFFPKSFDENLKCLSSTFGVHRIRTDYILANLCAQCLYTTCLFLFIQY